MSRRFLLVLSIFVVLIAGGIFGFVQIDRSNFGIPRFYVWRSLGGQFHGSNRAEVNGVSIYYETYGSGPPVLVLHGAAAFLESMHHFITALAPTHTVIAVDSRGQGRSTDSADPLTYAAMGDDMIKLMDNLHIARADVVGWSDGGIIGLDMAIKHPDRVRRLVAIGANYDVKGVDPKVLAPGFLDQEAQGVRPFYEAVAPDPKHFPVLMKKIEHMVTTEPHYTLGELGRIRARTEIVAGEHDLILRPHTDALAHAIPGAKEIIVPGATHFGPLEKPEAYNKIVVDFLDAP
ncbi:MAG: alpha/beta fold hydrolase [Alphaproteobacteria bacterium]|nr:alpha/beta fold hydrolase [Alphaproteobacteria bacterium]MBL6937071.1 alpha/beta fold hydrolase [Alphaproteobacteria bacterium]MBL7096367.1 alpha/beta fold hydrolase [Alphaproteobacteria bacterium]